VVSKLEERSGRHEDTAMETEGLAGHSGSRADAKLPASGLMFWIWCTPDRAPHLAGEELCHQAPPVYLFAFTVPAHAQFGRCRTASLVQQEHWHGDKATKREDANRRTGVLLSASSSVDELNKTI